jgi:hypothetical protein
VQYSSRGSIARSSPALSAGVALCWYGVGALIRSMKMGIHPGRALLRGAAFALTFSKAAPSFDRFAVSQVFETGR